jgi:cell wall assembly regulator SMI1
VNWHRINDLLAELEDDGTVAADTAGHCANEIQELQEALGNDFPADVLRDLDIAQCMLAEAAEHITYASLDLRNLLPWPDDEDEAEV